MSKKSKAEKEKTAVATKAIAVKTVSTVAKKTVKSANEKQSELLSAYKFSLKDFSENLQKREKDLKSYSKKQLQSQNFVKYLLSQDDLCFEIVKSGKKQICFFDATAQYFAVARLLEIDNVKVLRLHQTQSNMLHEQIYLSSCKSEHFLQGNVSFVFRVGKIGYSHKKGTAIGFYASNPTIDYSTCNLDQAKLYAKECYTKLLSYYESHKK